MKSILELNTVPFLSIDISRETFASAGFSGFDALL